MRCMGCAAVALVGFAVTGCTGLTDYPAVANEGGYAAPGYYAEPPGVVSGYYGGPYYAAPYSYPPAYVLPYGYDGHRRDRAEWEEHERREHGANAFQHGGHPPFGQPRPETAAGMSPHPVHPGPAAPPRPMTPPAAPPQAAQNKALLDQLGFRPNR
jgi:hypothetical protein